MRPVEANTSPWPGSTTFQPNRPSLKRANAIAFSTGSRPSIRVVGRAASSSRATSSEIADGGPRT